MIKRDLDNSIAKIVGLVGGFAILVWLMFYILDWIMTSTKFKNYMASELYTVDENELKGMTTTRTLTTMGFHNEIIPAKDRVLALSRVSFIHRLFCCCCRLTRGAKIFSKARDMSNQELNITSIIKSQRESKAALELLRASMGAKAEPVISANVKRIVDISGKATEASPALNIRASGNGEGDDTSVRLPLNGADDTKVDDANKDGSSSAAPSGNDDGQVLSPKTDVENEKKKRRRSKSKGGAEDGEEKEGEDDKKRRRRRPKEDGDEEEGDQHHRRRKRSRHADGEDEDKGD